MEEGGKSVSETVARRLEQMILDGKFVPNQKIPSERQLSTRLGVSRSIVREALKQLHGRGLIVTRHGQGSFVSEFIEQPEEEGPLMKLFFCHSQALYDLYEVREQLEGQAAYLAARRGKTGDLYFITKAFKALQEASAEERAQRDHEFHRAIAEAANNTVLVHVLASLKQLVLHSVQASISNLWHREEMRAQIDCHHRQIHDAIISGEAALAQQAASAHVRYVVRCLHEIEQQETGIVRATASDN